MVIILRNHIKIHLLLMKTMKKDGTQRIAFIQISNMVLHSHYLRTWYGIKFQELQNILL